MEALLERAEARTVEYDFEAAVCTQGISRVLIGGMDNAGKSTLACSLYLAMKAEGEDVSLHEIDPWSDTHEPILGKKPWSHRQKRHNVTPQLYQEFVDRFTNDRSSIVLGDMQGRANYEANYMLKESANIGMLVTRDSISSDLNNPNRQCETEWEELFEELNVPITLRVRSVAPGQQAPRGYYVVEGLDRQLVPNKPQIKNLGKMLIKVAKHNQKG